MKEILKKLSEIQATISVAKNQRNSFGNYNYRSCEDILQALQPYCEKLGVVILLTDEIKETLNYCYVESTAKIIDAETQQEISVKAQAGIQERKGMDLSQTFGASSSYARKYALNGLLKLDDNKDADTDAFTKLIKKEEKKNATQSDNNDSDLPFENIGNTAKNVIKKTTENFMKAHEENISTLELLRNEIDNMLFNLGNEDLTQAYGYYAKIYKKNSFEDLNEKELSEIKERLKSKLEKRA